MSSPDFPSTTPALIMRLSIGSPLLVGSVSRGTPCTVVPITGGSLQSVQGFNVNLHATFVGTGNDYIHNDAGGRHMRLDAHAIVKDHQANLIYLKYYGIIDITPELSAILGGHTEMKTTEFGHSFIHIQFETGCELYRELEVGVYVGAGRFIVDRENFEVTVQYNISRIVAGDKLEIQS